jgi:hypothetical protein
LEARIWIGLALGIDPATACGNIGFARGKPTFSAALQAALLGRHPRYSFHEIGEIDDQKAVLAFYRDDQQLGRASFTIEEAKRAGLTNKVVWQAYPSDLLFARALTRGVRRYAPDLLVGSAAITKEETGADEHKPISADLKTKPSKNDSPKEQSPTQPAQPARGTITDQQLADIKACRETLQIPLDAWRSKVLAKRGVKSALELSAEKATELLGALRTKINIGQMQEAMAMSQHRNGDLVVDLNAVGKGKEVQEAAGPNSKSN